ncbi:hypothetical protein SBRY_20466 [Actinacidiphila bryophytorum]|uniref:Uncharacterized protein n=1 Tax=Actinacidiphila bryophytorum TaxID=1436133 RepID=A0A9W4E7H8_9ACTN|nr:hypothetical protein SBRY_20466 [Actinacidiphila bryophytorum]
MAGATSPRPLSTFETVGAETPAARAISASVAVPSPVVPDWSSCEGWGIVALMAAIVARQGNVRPRPVMTILRTERKKIRIRHRKIRKAGSSATPPWVARGSPAPQRVAPRTLLRIQDKFQDNQSTASPVSFCDTDRDCRRPGPLSFRRPVRSARPHHASFGGIR